MKRADDPVIESGGGPNPAAIVPRWVRGASNLFATLVTAVLVGALLFFVGWLSPVLAPAGLGLFLAALAAPLVRWLEDRGRSPSAALALTIGLVLAVGVALVVLTLISVRTLSDSLGTYANDLAARYPDAGSSAGDLGAWIRKAVPPETLAAILRTTVAVVSAIGGTLVFAIVVAALLLLDGRRLSNLVATGLGSENPVFREAPGLANAAITYFTVRIRVNAVTAAGLLALMVVLGVDEPLLWAAGAFFLSFVPYLGLVVALIPPTILALAESGPLAAAAMILGGIALNVIAENVLEPALTGRALSLSTWLVFSMFFFWVWLMGPLGALLSMPITVLVVLVLRNNERTRWIAQLLARDPTHAVATGAAGAGNLLTDQRVERPRTAGSAHQQE